MVKRIDYWLGVLVVVAALFASRLLPRYEFAHAAGAGATDYVRIDHWTGQLDVGSIQTSGTWTGRWASAQSVQDWNAAEIDALLAKADRFLEKSGKPATPAGGR